MTTTLVDFHRSDEEDLMKFRHIFDRGRSARARIPRCLEFVKAGETLAFCVRVKISRNAETAFGFLSSDASVLNSFDSRIGLTSKLSTARKLWEPRGGASTIPVIE